MDNSTDEYVNVLKEYINSLNIELDRVKGELEELRFSSDKEILQEKLCRITQYDLMVKEVINSNETLKNAWDSFKMMYSLVVSDEICEIAYEKIIYNPEYINKILTEKIVLTDQERNQHG